MLTSEDKILIKPCWNLKDILPADSSRNSQTKIQNTNIGWLSAKDAYNQFDQMHCRMWSATVIPNCRKQCHSWRHS